MSGNKQFNVQLRLSGTRHVECLRFSKVSAKIAVSIFTVEHYFYRRLKRRITFNITISFMSYILLCVDR